MTDWKQSHEMIQRLRTRSRPKSQPGSCHSPSHLHFFVGKMRKMGWMTHSPAGTEGGTGEEHAPTGGSHLLRDSQGNTSTAGSVPRLREAEADEDQWIPASQAHSGSNIHGCVSTTRAALR